MQDDYLTRCVVDPVKRKFYLYSEQGDERVLDCETVDQFMSVLELCRAVLDEDTLAYSSPLWGKMTFNSNKGGKKIPAKIYPEGFYKEILECYEYETRNPSIYGNVIRGEMEFTQSSEELQSDGKRDENHV